MVKIAIKTIGKVLSPESDKIVFDDVSNNRKKRLFYKRTTILSIYAIKQALTNGAVELSKYSPDRIGLYTYERYSNNANIKETYKNLIRYNQLLRDSDSSLSYLLAKSYSLSDLFKFMPNLSNHFISMEFGIRGANKTILTGDGLDFQSLIDAYVDLSDNKLDLVVCGSSSTDNSWLEKKQISHYYHYNIFDKTIKESSVYVLLEKNSNASLYLLGGKTFFIKNSFNAHELNSYIKSLLIDFFSVNIPCSINDIDLILYLDQYNHPTTATEVEILKNIFPNAHCITPKLECDNYLCHGLLYLSFLYDGVYQFNKALIFQKNCNNIVSFILITK